MQFKMYLHQSKCFKTEFELNRIELHHTIKQHKRNLLNKKTVDVSGVEINLNTASGWDCHFSGLPTFRQMVQ